MKAIDYSTTGAQLPPDSLALVHIWTSDLRHTGALRWVDPKDARVVALIQESAGTTGWPSDLAVAMLRAAVDLPHTSSHQLSCGWDMAQWALVRRVGRARHLEILTMRGRGDNTGEES